MTELSSLRFRHSWRGYQQRVLAALDEHLEDARLHVIAPPGSGKTVLGLEVMRRLGAPALILSPTLTVREQWLRRFHEDFAGADQIRVSSSLDELGVVTSSTYQALAQVYGARQQQELLRQLDKRGVSTLVVDEAHHLRNTWWRCLEQLHGAVEGLTVLALTATPPYDAPQAEWNRYASFCGDVDEEISVPELVAADTLCPHQDYVFLCLPGEREQARLAGFRRGVAELVMDLALDFELADLVGELAQVKDPAAHVDEILADGELYLSLVIWLSGIKAEKVQALKQEIGLGSVQLPRFDQAWAQVMLDGLLGLELTDSPLVPHVVRLKDRLHCLGAITRGHVRLDSTRESSRLLRSSPAKLSSIVALVEVESRHQGPDLRLVILTDYIRRSELSQDSPEGFAKLGVVPIFETLRRVRLPGVRLAMLTGRMVVIPQSCEAALAELTAQLQTKAAPFRAQELAAAPGYCEIVFSSGGRQLAVELVTRLFRQGLVNTIVGTAALLGEGWDAPSINTLVLATVIGSFVTSNQMRGRAIRTWADAPDKAANIWHLACVEPDSFGGEDLEVLQRRFTSFVGPGITGTSIVSGIERLELPTRRFTPSRLTRSNSLMLASAMRREQLGYLWRTATTRSHQWHRLIRELTITPRHLGSKLVQRLEHRGGLLGWLRGVLIRRYLFKLGSAVIEALKAGGHWKGGEQRETVEVQLRGDSCAIRCPGATHLQQSRFVTTLAQVFDPLTHPRYLLHRHKSYLVVPQLFATNRSQAELFQRAVRRHLGRTTLVYTRSPSGKQALLYAQQETLITRNQRRTEVRMYWG